MGSTIIINHQRRMFVALWMTLLLTVRGKDANKVQTKEITREVGRSAVIPCHESGFTIDSAAWYKCEQNCTDSDIILSLNSSSSKDVSGLNGRVSLQKSDRPRKNYSIIIENLTKSDSGSYELRALNGANRQTICKAKITVTDVKKLEITGKTTVEKGGTLNLTCSVDSSPPSVLTWTKHGSNKILTNGTATLVISPVKLNHSGLYICTAAHLNNTLLKEVNVTVTSSPEILKTSGCTNHLKVLTCTCISRGDSLPSIKWPLLEKHKHFSVITTKSDNNTVNSTFILPTEGQSETDVECVSSNMNVHVTEKLDIKKDKQEDEDLIKKWLGILTRLEVIMAFLSGALICSSCCCICCLVIKCQRKKQKTRGDMDVTLEMVTSQEDPLMDGGQAVENNLDIDQEALQGEEGPSEGKPDADYSALDFSRIKRKDPAEAETTQETTETEYAEIKKGGAGQEEEEIGAEEVTGEAEETNCVEGEDAAAQSNMEGITGQSDDGVYR